MTEYNVRLAKTGVVNEGGVRVMITKEAIESLVVATNGDRVVPIIGPEHDPFCLPLGKIIEAWVEPLDNEYAVGARLYFEDDVQQLTHTASETRLVLLNFKRAPKPFKRKIQNTEQSGITVGVDWANFDSKQQYDQFSNDIEQIDEEVTCSNFSRHSLVPEPIIQFVITNPELSLALAAGGSWILQRVGNFASYTIDETSKRIAEELSQSLSETFKRIFSSYKRHRSNDHRPILTEYVIPGNTTLVLLGRTRSDEEFPGMNMRSLTAEMEKYGDLLQHAEEATFAQAEDGNWEFLHLKTRTGEVVGTLKCYERTAERFDELRRNSDTKEGGGGAKR